MLNLRQIHCQLEVKSIVQYIDQNVSFTQNLRVNRLDTDKWEAEGKEPTNRFKSCRACPYSGHDYCRLDLRAACILKNDHTEWFYVAFICTGVG